MVFGNAILQFVELQVSRENIFKETLGQIKQFNSSELKQPLKVEFSGEEGLDAGRKCKEFFRLLLREIFDPKYTWFQLHIASDAVWFSDTPFEEDILWLIGVICGLAIYNFTIINLPFPLALYKKLLNEPVDLSDLDDLSPVLASKIKGILDFQGDDGIQEFVRRTVSEVGMGGPLEPNGSEVAVTQENKQEFVNLYVEHIFNKSEPQFEKFREGFFKVCRGSVLEKFEPVELMAMMIGVKNYDWAALELQCEYKNGYTNTDPNIKMFWEVFLELSEQNKKKFLLHLTGCDRIPIQGMKEIAMTIQEKNDGSLLPVVRTCFNLLDLPRYETKESLIHNLLQALENPLGFGLV